MKTSTMDTLRRLWQDCYDRITQGSNKRDPNNHAPQFSNPSIISSPVNDRNEVRGKSDAENMQEFEENYTALIVSNACLIILY